MADHPRRTGPFRRWPRRTRRKPRSKAGKFKDEIVAVTVKGRKGDTVVDSDEYIRDGATYEAMTGLRPAFNKEGTVTAGNASGLNDGAAALVLMTRQGRRRARPRRRSPASPAGPRPAWIPR